MGSRAENMPEDIEISTSYLRLTARVWGSKAGLPVLALHGWLDNAASFDQLAPRLPGLRLIALDLPGHGLSDHRPPGVHYHFIDFIADTIAAADALGWDKFALLGHSLGAGIASFVAAVVPERITHLALIEGLGPLSGNPLDGPAALATAIAQMKHLKQKRLPVYSSLEEAIRARYNAGGLSWRAAAILTIRGTQSVPTGISWRSDPRLTFKSPLYLTEEQVLAYLARIRAPALLIRGESGYLARREYMAKRYICVPQLEVKELAGSHHLHLEQPVPVSQPLTRFFGLR